VDNGVFLRGRKLIFRGPEGEQPLLDIDEMKLRGMHNVENVAAAFAAGIAAGAPVESMNATAKRFDPVEHRLEFVAEIDGVKFYNDSKATSVDATLKALEAFAQEPGKVVLILGGRGKKAPYAPLEPLIRTKARKLVLIGEDAETIANELGSSAPFERASDMKDAVARSFEAAETGDVVLLAPACASFDMFESFEHRGKVFKEEVSRAAAQRRNEIP
jgi:UDP-N-acetylmuramoylalanine--D-glutamate ligase